MNSCKLLSNFCHWNLLLNEVSGSSICLKTFWPSECAFNDDICCNILATLDVRLFSRFIFFLSCICIYELYYCLWLYF
uniref:Uncharacterized protein n=1 Tax=Kalanchoe fedtschenkoi TaxID=63787 RepID=A0A7N0VHN9_KALFE